MHVLIIENDRDTREVLSWTLGEAGHQVLEASRVSDGLRLARLNPDIAVVLIDVHLGDRLTGLDILVPLRERLNHAQFVLVSGDWDALQQAAPGARVLCKPCGRNEVLAVVDQAIEAYRAEGGTQRPLPTVIRRQFRALEGQGQT